MNYVYFNKFVMAYQKMNGYGTKKSSNECDADMTLLMHASYGGYLESVKVLVKNRADVNVKSKLGATALKLAKIKVIEDLLIAFGAKE